MKTLVTGATGFVGNYVIQELLKNNHEVIASSIDADDKHFSWASDVQYIACNLNDEKKDYFRFFQKPDLLIHLSWEGLPNYQELFHFERNLFKNYRFLKNIIENGLNNVTVIGTCLEYGMKNGPLREDMESNPNNPYALAKDTLRKFLVQLQEKIAFNFKWLRLFYVYGKGQRPNSILSQLDTALNRGDKEFNMSGGEQLRDYLPVEKVAEYIVKVVTQNKVAGIINCCSGSPISIRKLVEDYLRINKKIIELKFGYYSYHPYEPMAFWGDTSKLEKTLRK